MSKFRRTPILQLSGQWLRRPWGQLKRLISTYVLYICNMYAMYVIFMTVCNNKSWRYIFHFGVTVFIMHSTPVICIIINYFLWCINIKLFQEQTFEFPCSYTRWIIVEKRRTVLYCGVPFNLKNLFVFEGTYIQAIWCQRRTHLTRQLSPYRVIVTSEDNKRFVPSWSRKNW